HSSARAWATPPRSRWWIVGCRHRSGRVRRRKRRGRAMQIEQAQREMRTRFAGGLYGQAVSGVLWLGSAFLAQLQGPRPAILLLVLGGFLIFPLTEALVRLRGGAPLSRDNALKQLGMQVAFVLPLSMPLLLP